MKKFYVLFVLLLLLVTVTNANADTKIEFNVYKCKICDKEFRCFKGEDLTDSKYRGGNDQLKYLFQFWKYDKNFPECKSGSKFHYFDKKGTTSMTLSNLSRQNIAEYVAAIKDGRNASGVKLVEWECVYCKKHFYFLNDDNPNNPDWDQQTSYIYNLKGRSIQKCTAKNVYGHIFGEKRTSDVKSYDLAKNADNVYWVRN